MSTAQKMEPGQLVSMGAAARPDEVDTTTGLIGTHQNGDRRACAAGDAVSNTTGRSLVAVWEIK